MSTMPTRVDGDLSPPPVKRSSPQSERRLADRALGAAIGREFEASNGVNHRDVEAVLAATVCTTRCWSVEQAIVRGTWDEQIAERLASLDLAKKFKAAGVDWFEADDEGNIVAAARLLIPADLVGRPDPATAGRPDGAGKSTFVAEASSRSRTSVRQRGSDRSPRGGRRRKPRMPTGVATLRDRSRLMAARAFFISETVSAHPSKVEPRGRGNRLGDPVHLHVILVRRALAVRSVAARLRRRARCTRTEKIRERYARLWPGHRGPDLADRTTSTTTFVRPSRSRWRRRRAGRLVGEPAWPAWTPRRGWMTRAVVRRASTSNSTHTIPSRNRPIRSAPSARRDRARTPQHQRHGTSAPGCRATRALRRR